MTNTIINSTLRGLLSSSEMEHINKKPDHPLFKLLISRGTDQFIDAIIPSLDLSLKQIVHHGHDDFLKHETCRLIGGSSDVGFTDVFAALSEIRALGYLKYIGMKDVKADVPKASKGGTADFHFEYDSLRVLVETTSKQYVKSVKNYYGSLKNQNTSQSNRVTVSEACLAPYGFADQNKDENVTENCISKICSIKQDEHQIRKDIDVNILWLDLCSPNMTIDGFFPVSSNDGNLYSGCLWYAFYGVKGIPIYEGFNYEYETGSFSIMKHDGRFQIGSDFNFIVMVTPYHTVVFENHNNPGKETDALVERLLHLPNCDVSQCQLNFPDNCLKDKVKIELNKIIEYQNHNFFE